MVASRLVKIPFYRAEGDLGLLHKLLEFAAPEIGEVISGRKSFKMVAKSVGKQTLIKHVVGGSQQRRISSTKPTKQSSRSRRDVFTNISR